MVPRHRVLTSSHLAVPALLVALALVMGPAAYAGSCCEKVAENTKEGKTCAKCETHACCKKAAKNVADAKPCEKCAAKKKA